MSRYQTIEEFEQILGEQIRTLRLMLNLDQRELAAQAGIALNAVKRLESGKTSTTRSLISVLRVLGRTDWLTSLSPNITINPITMANLKSPRQRVFKKRKSRKGTADGDI
ncbi:MAG: helix-turn-helix domain-containing protein [Geobacter sp.]|nr:helix-turn-helix domain-containing protein [Geobacter sp.]